jgi:catechol 2,3-dioxygenase-like lactoylglutathione lyase family enzyme
MIQGLFETHINVSDLERSIAFYCGVLGLELGRREEERRVAFLLIGGRSGAQAAMLGLWEKPREQVVRQHIAFRASVDDVVEHSVAWLKERCLSCSNFLDDGTERPMVFAWMPAISIYFRDPDGHSLEFIALLQGTPRPELGVVSWEEWKQRSPGPEVTPLHPAGVMRSAGIHEIVLVVKDVGRAARFYRDVVGLAPLREPTDEWASFSTVSFEHPQWLGLRRGDLLYEEHSPRPKGARFGPVHFALRALDPSPQGFLQRAEYHGLRVYGPQEWDGRMKGRSYYCYDPDDNLFEYWFPARPT